MRLPVHGRVVSCPYTRIKSKMKGFWACWTYLDPDRKSTRLNSSHLGISYAVFCLKKSCNTADALQVKAENPVTHKLYVLFCYTYFIFLNNGPPPRFTLLPNPVAFRF